MRARQIPTRLYRARPPMPVHVTPDLLGPAEERVPNVPLAHTKQAQGLPSVMRARQIPTRLCRAWPPMLAHVTPDLLGPAEECVLNVVSANTNQTRDL